MRRTEFDAVIKELRQWYVECYCGERMETGDYTYDLENIMATFIRLRSRLSLLKGNEDARFIGRYLTYVIQAMEKTALTMGPEGPTEGPTEFAFNRLLRHAHDDVAFLLKRYEEANYAE